MKLFRIDWEGTRRCADFERHLLELTRIRLLSDLANWTSYYLLILIPYAFVNLSMSLAASVLGATSLPAYVYALLPATSAVNILVLMVLIPSAASVLSESKKSIMRMNQAMTQLQDLDKRKLQLLKRQVKSQRPFGCKLGMFSFASVNTACDVIVNSISNSILITSLMKR